MNNITIVFSGHNILNWLRTSILSFIAYHPSFIDNIVVFDDNSTDGTKAWLINEKIKTISWTKHKKAAELVKINQETGYYCSLLMDDLMSQIDTKYLFVSDGDVIYLKNILDIYLDKVIHEYRLAGYLYDLDISFDRNDPRINKILDKFDYYNIMQGNRYFRIANYCFLMDLEYFKSKGILFDRITPEWKIMSTLFDFGADFLSQMLHNRIKWYNYMPKEEVYHFEFISSMKKMKKIPNWKKNQLKLQVKQINNNRKLIGEMAYYGIYEEFFNLCKNIESI